MGRRQRVTALAFRTRLNSQPACASFAPWACALRCYLAFRAQHNKAALISCIPLCQQPPCVLSLLKWVRSWCYLARHIQNGHKGEPLYVMFYLLYALQLPGQLVPCLSHLTSLCVMLSWMPHQWCPIHHTIKRNNLVQLSAVQQKALKF